VPQLTHTLLLLAACASTSRKGGGERGAQQLRAQHTVVRARKRGRSLLAAAPSSAAVPEAVGDSSDSPQQAGPCATAAARSLLLASRARRALPIPSPGRFVARDSWRMFFVAPLHFCLAQFTSPESGEISEGRCSSRTRAQRARVHQKPSHLPSYAILLALHRGDIGTAACMAGAVCDSMPKA
jgi:hypothetical protein